MKKSFLSFAAVLCALLCLSSMDAKAQNVKLFNGKNLSNWNLFVDKGGATAQEVFTVKEGTIHVKGTPFGYMYTKEKYSNFILNVEWCYPEEFSQLDLVSDQHRLIQKLYGSKAERLLLPSEQAKKNIP